MTRDLSGKRIATFAADGFEQIELSKPREAPDRAGAGIHIVSPADSKVKGWKIPDDLPAFIAHPSSANAE